MKEVLISIFRIFTFLFISWLLLIFLQLSRGCGLDQTINDRAYDSFPFFIALVVMFSLLYFVYHRYKCKKVGRAIINLVFMLVPLSVLLTDTEFMDRSNYYENFDSQKWKTDKTIKMTRSIVSSQLLNGQSQEEVVKLLGPHQYNAKLSSKQRSLEYWIKGGNYLIVKFENGKVVSSHLSCND